VRLTPRNSTTGISELIVGYGPVVVVEPPPAPALPVVPVPVAPVVPVPVAPDVPVPVAGGGVVGSDDPVGAFGAAEDEPEPMITRSPSFSSPACTGATS
jgi:hypothetical protein